MGIINWESKLGLRSKTSIVVQKTQPIAQIMQLSNTRNLELLYATMMSPINVEELLKETMFSRNACLKNYRLLQAQPWILSTSLKTQKAVPPCLLLR